MSSSKCDNSIDISIVVRACSSYHDFCDSAPAEMTTMSQKAPLPPSASGFLPRMASYSTNKFLVNSALADNAWDWEDILQMFKGFFSPLSQVDHCRESEVSYW